MAVTIDAGERRYELVEGWGQPKDPRGWVWGVVGAVGVDSKDQVHVFTRHGRHFPSEPEVVPDQPYLIYDKKGKLLDSWGKEIFDDSHGICITPNDDVFLIDRDPQLVMKFSKAGHHLLTLGKRGQTSNTGWSPDSPTVKRAAGPFNNPTDVSVSALGGFYVSDGYRNSRVHKYSDDGQLQFSWGAPGSGPGQFNLVHSVWEHKGKVYVADRNNNRIQVFTPYGDYIEEWGGFLEPCKIYIDKHDVLYLAELGGRVSIVTLEGKIIGQWGGQKSYAPGYFYGPHGIWTDSEDSIYVAEVLLGARLQKFARVR